MWTVLAVARTAAAVEGTSASMPTLPKPVATRQRQFTIPFRIDPPRVPIQDPLEVQLHASTDQGKTWKLQARVPPQAAQFAVRVPSDGEYWFLVRTLDRGGRLRPDRPTAPELRVIVDTTPPLMKLNASRGPDFALLIDYLVSDANIDFSSLKLQYRTSDNSPWTDAIVNKNQSVQNGVVNGRLTLPEVSPKDAVQLRAEIRDLAGNPAVSSSYVPGDALWASKQRRRAVDSQGNAASSSLPELASVSRRSSAKGAELANWPPDGGRTSAYESLRSEEIPVPSGVEEAIAANTMPPPEAIPTPGVAAREAIPQGPYFSPVSDAMDESNENGIYVEAVEEPSWENLPDDNTLPVVTDNLDDDVVLRKPHSPAAFGERNVLMFNTLSFAVDYEIEGALGGEIASVELWGTQDGGKSWQKFGTDADGKSPFVANVRGEGLYGFQIVVHSTSGLSGRPPQPADVPEFWVEIDRTRPQAKLTGVELGASENMGQLLIRWEANDKNLVAHPIALNYSTNIDGPWKSIATDLKNSERYSWRINSDVPDEIYLRLEVTDAAGNLGIYETSEPISLELARPKAHIRQVRPVRTSQRRAKAYQFFH